MPTSRQSLLVLGLMSGTSADAIEIALARISPVKRELLDHTSIVFPEKIRKEILRVAEQTPMPAAGLSQLNFRLGEVFAEAALEACRGFRVSPKKVGLIGSHGQTIFHQGQPVPYLGRRTASTLQIGEPAIIAAGTGITTIADFRPADIAAGGQGAPLVPFADYLLYSHKSLGRVSLNLGGIANVTVIPANAKPSDLFGFDTGPANMLIDALVARFTHNRQHYDKNARLAQQGRSVPALLDELMRDPYLKQAPPKSTGREYYGRSYVENVLRLAREHRAKPNDLIRAATIFTALSVVDALNRFVLPKTKIHQLIVSGGGSHNPLLMAQICAALSSPSSVSSVRSVVNSSFGSRARHFPRPGIDVVPSSRLGIPVDAKEPFAFALLAYETFHHRPSNLPSATGARRPAVLGKICYPPPR